METLAVVYALDRFRTYLTGIPFAIITNCNSFVLTFSKKDTYPRIARWIWEFQGFNFNIKHKIGTNMGHVDTLSRNPTVCLIHPNDIEAQLEVTQNRDPTIQRLQETLSTSDVPSFDMQNGIVYRKTKENRLLFYVPKEMEQQLIAYVHEKIGHFGSDKCYDKIKANYWFPGLEDKNETFVKNCIKCIVHSAPVGPSRRSLYSILKKPIPFHTVHIDHFGPLPSVKSKQKHLQRRIYKIHEDILIDQLVQKKSSES